MKTSSARRVAALLKKAHDWPVTKSSPSIRIWAQIFAIQPQLDGVLSPQHEDAVVGMLQDVRAEITEVTIAATGTEFEELIAPIAQTARNLTTATQLHMDWNTIKTNHLRADFLSGWQWAAKSLPAFDELLDESVLGELLAQLKELEQLVEQPEVPSELRAFIRRQIDTIKLALRKYEVRGAGPLRAAVSQVAGDMLKEGPELQAILTTAPEAGRTAFQKLGTVWQKAAKLCGDIDNFYRGIQILQGLYDKVSPLIQHVKTYLALPPGQ